MFIKVSVLVLGVAMCCSSAMAHAADSDSSKQFDACMDKSGGVTSEMLNCIGAETKVQDARLNLAYKGLMATLTPSRKQQLQAAERAWLKYRDANCSFYEDPDGGTLATVNGADCIRSSTTSRAKELQGFLNN